MEERKEKKVSDKHLEYIIKRWSKIASAIYIVSSFIKDNDQIKWNLRNRCLTVLSLVHELHENSEQRHVVLDVCSKEIELLIQELDLAKVSHIIGSMNHELISFEILAYRGELEEFKVKRSLLSPLQPEFMHVEKEALFTENRAPESIGHYIGQGKGLIESKPKTKDLYKKDTKRDLSERKEKIIRLVRGKGSVSIKDIASAITDCSQKTIQTRACSLVAEGILVKSGDRRWSVYSLKSL